MFAHSGVKAALCIAVLLAALLLASCTEPPIAVDDAFATTSTTPIQGNVLAANPTAPDSDPAGETITVTAVNGNAGAIGTQVTLPSGALVQVDTAGTFTYDPAGGFDSLDEGDTATDSFTYTITSGSGKSATATVTVTVTGFIVGGGFEEEEEEVEDIEEEEEEEDTGETGDEEEPADQEGTGEGDEEETGDETAGTEEEEDDDGEVVVAYPYYPYDDTDEDQGQPPVTVNNAPTAVDDAVTTDEDTPLNGNVLAANPATADSDPDSDPLAVSAVNGNTGSVGIQVTLTSGALLLVNADGTFTYDPNGQYESLQSGDTDTDSFTYTVTDGSASDIATVTVTITGIDDPPLAIDDAVTTDEDTLLAGDVLAANPTTPDSDPAGRPFTVTEVNGDAANVSVQITLASGALLQVEADGTFTYDPNGHYESLAPGDTDTDSFDYTLTNDIGLSDTATVTITITGIDDAPVATGDAYTTAGNTLLQVAASKTVDTGVFVAGSVLDNDIDIDTTGASFTASLDTSTPGASVVMAADGTFTYVPAAGATGTDSFTYTLSDGTSTATGTVTITLVDEVWYVDNSVAGPGTGTSADPFTTLAAAEAASGTDDIIYLFEGSGSTGMDAGITLKNGQQLIGEGAALVVNSETIRAAGNRPSIASISSDGITLAVNNTIRGLDIGDTLYGHGISGSSAGSVTVDSMRISGSGGLVDIDNTTLDMTFDGLSSANSTTAAIDLNNVTGTFTVSDTAGTDTAISNAFAEGIDIRNSSGAFTFGDAAIGGVAGIDLDTNAGATLSFTSLTVSTTGGAGFVADNSGTITIIAAPSISATGGPAIAVANTNGSIGGSDTWRFASATSVDSPVDGVNFTNIGGDIDLSGIDIDNPAGDGIEINTVTGTVRITGTGSIDGYSTNGHGILLRNVTGAATIQGADASNRFEITGIGKGTGTGDCGVFALNSGDLTVQYLAIDDTGQSGDEHGIAIEDPLNGNRSVLIDENMFATIGDASSSGAGSAIDLLVSAAASYSGVLDIDITSNDINGDGSGFNTTNQGVNLDLTAGSPGSLDADISNNDIDGVREGIAVTIQGNAGSGVTRNLITIDNNTIDDLDNNGIEIDVTDDFAGLGSSNTRAVIRNNSLTAANSYSSPLNDPDTAIEVEARGTSSPILSADITGNTIGGTADAPGFRWDGDGISVGSAGTGAFSGALYFDIENNTIDFVEDAGIYVKADESATVNARLTGNLLQAGAGDGIEVEFESTDTAIVNLYLSGNDAGAGNYYDIETTDAGTLNLEADAGSPVPTGPAFGVPTLTSVLAYNGNTVGGGPVNTGNTLNPGGAAYTIVPAGSTPGAD